MYVDSTGLASGSVPMPLAYISGRYYGSIMTANTSTLNASTGTMYFNPVWISKRATFTAIGSWPTVAVSIAAKFGIYTSNPTTGLPNALISGSEVTIGTLTAAAANDATFSSAIALDPGLYWLACTTNGSATFVAASGACGNSQFFGRGAMVTSGTATGLRFSATLVYGSLPAAAPALAYTESQSCIDLCLKAQ